MELKLIDDQSSSLSVSDKLFDREYNEGLVHQLIVAYQANARQGTRAQKGRSDVAKSTRKPWRQKGTGRARAGMASSPIWRGGGKIFPSSPDENFTQKINKKMYRAGMACILSKLVREDRLSVIRRFSVDTPKTKLLQEKLGQIGFSNVLIITDSCDDNLWLSSRNLPHVFVLEAHQADPLSLVRFERVLVTEAAIRSMEEVWA